MQGRRDGERRQRCAQHVALALEVQEAVAAEALAAGKWYYGAPTPADVKEALERARKAGAFSVRPAGRER